MEIAEELAGDRIGAEGKLREAERKWLGMFFEAVLKSQMALGKLIASRPTL